MFLGVAFSQDATLKETDTYKSLTLTAADTTTSNQSLSKTFQVKSNHPFVYKIAMDVDSVDSPDIDFIIQESIDNAIWTNVDTVAYAGTADTTFVVDVTSANREARFIKISSSGTGEALWQSCSIAIWVDE